MSGPGMRVLVVGVAGDVGGAAARQLTELGAQTALAGRKRDQLRDRAATDSQPQEARPSWRPPADV